MDKIDLHELRRSAAQGDGAGVMKVLKGRVQTELLQLGGDCLFVAVRQEVPGGADLSRFWADGLMERGWAGDEVLAGHLREAIGDADPGDLKLLTVDLEELADVLESGDFDGGVVDLILGDVWTSHAMEYATETEDPPPDFEDPTRWLYISPEGSHEAYRDMERFIGTLEDPEVRQRLQRAIQGRGAFRRFKDTVRRWADVETAWYRFSDERRRGRAREWLADAGYRVDPR